MSGAVTARIGWPEACGGPCEACGLGRAFERSRAVMRVFRNGADTADSFRMKSPSHRLSGGKARTLQE